MLGIKISINLTSLPLTCITLVKAKIALCVGITEELLIQDTHTHTHTHTQAFPSLPTACLQPPSCQHDPSAPPQNQTLLIETWWQSGRCGSHVSYWWFMSSYKAASLIKRSHRPAHRPSHTPKVLVKHISFLLNVVFVKLQRVPTGTGRHVKNPEMSLQRETLWFHGAVVIMGGVSGHVCGCVLVCAEDFRAATQPEFLALRATSITSWVKLLELSVLISSSIIWS